ncbi:hypothetical protein BXY82_0444 [Gelidibacter sediminis]|uniref:Uncharacterized protein n=1 Tax=Gelidibacter sediminis TaxID=1608710 RepID=A0A4R7Q819_9FLAO|nr:hypothetical protein BXY82_0444 [Gelidibacter sediminis]
MKKFITDRNLTIINFALIFYFIGLYLLYIYQVNSVILGFFVEILTIPLMLAQIVFVIIGIIYLIKHSVRILTLVSVIALIICSTLTIGSFF